MHRLARFLNLVGLTTFVLPPPAALPVDGLPVPGTPAHVSLERARGALLGLACGDALGAPLEFSRRDSKPPVTGMRGGGAFRLRPGCWTDDTAMALCLADHLAAHGAVEPGDLMRRFDRWVRRGAMSPTGVSYGLGTTVHGALAAWRRSGDPLAGSTDPATAGNGALMRLAPAVVRFHRDREAAVDAADRQGRVTHGAEASVEACQAFAGMLWDALNGADKATVLAPRGGAAHPHLAIVLAGGWRGKTRADIRSTGFVVNTLEAALWCVDTTSSLEEALLLAANLGDDSDTVAAVAGQLAGALYGAAAIPDAWLRVLVWQDAIKNRADRLWADGQSTRSNQRRASATVVEYH